MLPNCKSRVLLPFVLIAIFTSALSLNAQNESPAQLKVRARALIDAAKLTEALPLYERLVQLTPNDSEAHLYLGFSLMGQIAVSTDPEIRKQLRIRARNAYIKAKELGDKSVAVQGYIEGIAADGAEPQGFSDNAEANKLMDKAEAAFATGKMDDALASYQAALKIDPRCYHAALFSGDVYVQQENFGEAEKWYQRAIAIDQYRETAYRYSATPLMKQQRFEQARDRYIEAFIAEPYNNTAIGGIAQWGQITKTNLGHPKISIPEITVGADGKYNANISISADPSDGSLAWGSYVTTREEWRKQKFAVAFPSEKQYRHSLKEEADALRSVITSAKALKPAKLNPQIAKLAELDQSGVLEAFILMATPDRGIAQDHAAYIRANRDKLRLYVMKYVIENK